MEKKEIQEWRDRLIKMFGIYHSDGQEYITCPLCGINLDELAKHMIEELDKAREEGRMEMRNEILELEDIDVNQEGDMEKKGYVLVNAIDSLES